MTKLEMQEFFAMAEKLGFEGMKVEYLYQAFKARLASECALELFPDKESK